MVTPTMLGHIYMATVNPDTRVGLKGIISGYVDRQWARHHYGLWYKENFEGKVQSGTQVSAPVRPPDHRVHIHCPSCTENMMVSWTWILHKISTARSMLCPKCGVTLEAIRTITNQEELEWVQLQLRRWRVRAVPGVGPSDVATNAANCTRHSGKLTGKLELMIGASMSEGPQARRRIKELEVMVADVIVETPETATLILFTGNDRLEYKAGHFLTIDPHQLEALERFTAFLEDLKGKKEPPRAYSLSSAPHERHLAITVKRRGTRPARPVSPAVVAAARQAHVPGDASCHHRVHGALPLTENIESETDHIVHICAGSGIVPNYSIVKDALNRHPRLRHTLLYANKTWDDIIFLSELQELEQRHPDRLRVVHSLTREGEEFRFREDGRKGRITTELLRSTSRPRVRACLCPRTGRLCP